MRNFIIKHDKIILRSLEILPGFFSWNVILFPYWGIFVIPNVVAYFILLFNIYWFYQSCQTAITAIISHLKIQASKNYDWLGDLKNFPDWKKVHQAVIVPTVKEPLHTLDRTLSALANQTFPTKQMIIILATEGRVPEVDRLPKIKVIKDKFGKVFGNIFVTVHNVTAGEIIGKASNERYAAIEFKKAFLGI